MMHYTIMPDEIVWVGYEELEKKEYREVQYGHMTMVIEQISQTEAQLVRIISPNPYDFTNPHFAPGAKIVLQPFIL